MYATSEHSVRVCTHSASALLHTPGRRMDGWTDARHTHVKIRCARAAPVGRLVHRRPLHAVSMTQQRPRWGTCSSMGGPPQQKRRGHALPDKASMHVALAYWLVHQARARAPRGPVVRAPERRYGHGHDCELRAGPPAHGGRHTADTGMKPCSPPTQSKINFPHVAHMAPWPPPYYCQGAGTRPGPRSRRRGENIPRLVIHAVNTTLGVGGWPGLASWVLVVVAALGS